MASVRLKRINKDGSKVYEIIAARNRGESMKTTRWTAKPGWSQKYIDRELKKAAEEFDRKVKSGEVLSRAEKAERDREAAATEAQIKTVKEYAESVFIPYKETRCAPRTIEYYYSMLVRYILPEIGGKKIGSVRAVDLKRLLTEMQSKGLAFSTVRGAYLTLSQVFKQANFDDVIDNNPMLKVESPRRRKDDTKSEITIFTDDQLEYLFDCFEQEPLKWQAFFNILKDTGMRKGEACAIRWDAIDFNTGWVLIDKNVIRIAENGKTAVRVVATKNGNIRSNQLTPYTLQLLEELREEYGQYEYVFVQRSEEGYLYGSPIIPNSADAYLRKFVKKYDIDFKCNPHRFRHTRATKMQQAGVPPVDIARYLGDTVETIIKYYFKSDSQSLERAAMSIRKEWSIKKQPTHSQHGDADYNHRILLNDSKRYAQ